MKKALALSLIILAANSFAQSTQEKEGPCKQIEQVCEKAGFVKGEAKEGYGLWVDCIDPIMKGVSQPAKAKKPLPAVGGDLISACKAKNPSFGQGHGKQSSK
jgi:hypothetical protein